MPEFSTEVDIDPSEFIDACSKRERDRLIEILEEDGYIQSSTETLANNNGVRRPNINDEIFWDALKVLMKSRHLLTLEEEQTIIKISDKFKFLY
jgi:hypothetical protein